MTIQPRSVLAAIARLAAIAAMIALVLPAMLHGSMTQTGLFAGFAGAALIGVFKHGLFKPLGLFERFLLLALTLASFAGLLPWLLTPGTGDTALTDGQLCADGWSAMAPTFTAYTVAVGVAVAAFAFELLRLRRAIIAASKPDTNPPLPIWLIFALVIFCAALMVAVAITLNQMTCGSQFDPLSVVLPVTVAFSALLVCGYITIAKIHHARHR